MQESASLEHVGFLGTRAIELRLESWLRSSIAENSRIPSPQPLALVPHDLFFGGVHETTTSFVLLLMFRQLSCTRQWMRICSVNARLDLQSHQQENQEKSCKQ